MELRGAKIAVTGATGFLGKYIVRELLESGAEVIAVVRNPDRAPSLKREGVSFRRADLAEPEQLRAGFEGVDAVVSNAGLITLDKVSPDDFIQTNVDGIQNALEATKAAGVRRFVHISSTTVYRKMPWFKKIHEGAPIRNASDKVTRRSAYPISKAMAEQFCREYAEENDLDLTILRPPGCFGANDPTVTHVFKRIMKLPITPFPFGTRVSLVYGGDVGRAVALALEREVSIGKTYNISGTDETGWDFKDAWRKAGGKTPYVLLPFPFPLTHRFENESALNDLGWAPRCYIEALAETFEIEKEDDGEDS